MTVRRRITVTGTVQGVGFRPFAYALAERLGLAGFVGNDDGGVFIEIEGTPEAVERFEHGLVSDPPPLSTITGTESIGIAPTGDRRFDIAASSSGGDRTALVTPDAATCPDCLAELFDPADRRHGYPFVNCTNCGPRFTITSETPYDRPNTTMAAFEMCELCRSEYEDPSDRRFHAQPNACPACGPHLVLDDTSGGDTTAIAAARTVVARGGIVAIKGLGGFHLACDATNDEAVRRLRRRKGRQHKPLAVMAADLETALRHVRIGPGEREVLVGSHRPILLLVRDEQSTIAPSVAPGNRTVGLMLPYTPLHHLLLEPGDVWVMTSGNHSGEPIVTSNDAARRRLGQVADVVLAHDRPIHTPCDDSVIQVVDGEIQPIRRSRGYAPFPITLPFEVEPTLAVGGELKATFCLAEGLQAFMSQHIGDMENVETLAAFERAEELLERLLRIRPEVIAADLHPGYLSSRWAEDRHPGRVQRVQHHHAHLASVLGEHCHTDPVIGFCFDGTGYGTDRAIWGGEVLVGDIAGYQRQAHLAQVPLPGGDAAVRRPARMALAHLWSAGLDWDPSLPAVAATSERERKVISRMLEGSVNTVPTSSMGRLFDAVASLTGVRHEVTYEAQAAIELEALADEESEGDYRMEIDTSREPWSIQPDSLLRSVTADAVSGTDPGVMSARFHRAVAGMMVSMAELVRDRTGIATVALSGGVFQNALLTRLAASRLREADLTVLTHRLVPPNDGGLALGQALVANARRS